MSGKDLDTDSEEMWKHKCTNCIRCNEKTNCGQCGPCRTGKTCEKRRCFSAKRMYEESVKNQTEANLRAIMAKTAQREAQLASTSTAYEKTEPQEKKKRGRKKKEVVEREQRERMQKQSREQRQITEDDYVPNRPTRQQSQDLRRKKAHKPELQEPEVYHEPVQCLNPDCIFEAEPYSKYCSQECGMALARLRLAEHLPKRVAQHFGDGPAGPKTVAAEIEARRVQWRDEFQKTKEQETVLIAFLQKLDDFVKSQLDLKPLGTEERFDDNVSEYCVICGGDIQLRKYVKHIDICWSRSEKVMAFGAPEKCDEKIYCEVFDARCGTYCKRLKSLCPEHRKPGVEQHLSVCGYPKKWIDMFGTAQYTGTFAELIALDDPFGDEGCRTVKDVCSMHLKWIPSIRGCIELEQAGFLQKVHELYAEAARLQDRSEWNTNALSIMIHPDKSKVVDKDAFANFVRRIQGLSISAAPPPPPPQDAERSFSSEASSSSSREKTDDDMNDVGLFLAELAVQKEQQAALERLRQQDDGQGSARQPPPSFTPPATHPSIDTNSFNMLSISSTSDAPPPPPIPAPPAPPLISPPTRPPSNFSVDRFLK